ncbi:MAG: SIS domain-containing protein [Actinomycetota bacterium]|nr:SIS domain-containing protein [Actinomycetota bacterium]
MSDSFMAAEMAEQPDVLARLAGRAGEIEAAVRGVTPGALAGIILVARGSSDYAAIYGRYAIEIASRRPVALAAPSIQTLYQSPTDLTDWLAIAVSQSGRTPEIVTMTEKMRAAGARSIAVTNTPESPLAAVADVTIDLAAGEEKAVPATKTFSASLLAFALIAQALGPGELRDRMGGASGWVQWVLDDPGSAERVATELHYAEGLIAVGRGYMFSVALEAALKLKETTSILAEGYSAADLRHGPIAVVERDFPVLTFNVPGPAAPDMDELIAWLRSEPKAHVMQAHAGDGADLPLPPDCPEALAPIPAAVRAQQVALQLALRKGLDPDKPEGLSKVTATT